MSRLIPSKQLVLRSLAATCGAGLFGYLVWRVGPSKLALDVSRLGWGFALIIVLGGIAHAVKAWAWRFNLAGEHQKVSFSRLLQLRLVSEAVGQLGVLGQAFGEGIRVSALNAEIPAASRISSVTLDRGLFIATGALVMLAGILTAPFALRLGHSLQRYLMIFAAGLICFLLLTAFAVQKRWPIFSAPVRAAGKLRYFSRCLDRKESVIESVESRLFEFHRVAPRAFWASLMLNLVWHGMAILEVYLIVRLLGVRMGFVGALMIEALTKVVNVVGFFNPGNIGTYEGGNVLIAKMLRLGADTGLAVGLARRVRAVFWGAVGSLCMIMLSRDRKRHDSATPTVTPSGAIEEELSMKTASKFCHPSGPTALILASRWQEATSGSSLAKIGTLPVPLRTILGLQKAGCGRTIICCDSAKARDLRRELLATRRLPPSVEWFEMAHDGRGLPVLLGKVVGEAGEKHVLIVDGSTAYHPALLRDVAAWNREDDALVLTSGDSLVGICALSPEIARAIAAQTSVPIETIEQLNSFLVSQHSVQHTPVPEQCWQRIMTAEQRMSAEQKLDGWLVKPTDGIFARMNRRISVPISRQLIKWPITPNMVSLFTLGVGFASGVFFARGTYWSVLMGAMLSLWASILDGSDGEVARLKLLESDFGCWLETICDYLYYLFVFSGMAIGLVRSSGPAYLVWSGMLLFGAVTSFLVTGAGRRRFAGEHPEQYLKIWQRHAESRSGNPILYLGRHLEFIVRRCFFPYALLFFAAVNLTKVAFILTAIGVNVVWLISLYSYRSFVVASSPSADRPAVSL